MSIQPPTHFKNQLSSIFLKSANAFLSLLFPWQCPRCNCILDYPNAICEGCAEALKRIQEPLCKICGAKLPGHWKVDQCLECKSSRPALTKIRSVYLYEDLVMDMVRNAKYRRAARPLRFFAGEMFCVAKQHFPSTIQAVVPVPLHQSREWERTYNQAALLANGIARLWDLPVWNALRKTGKTPPQSSLSGLARRANLRNAFQFRGGFQYNSVLLVDDVVTTGSTMDACARILRRNGVRRIYGITIARAMLRS